VVAAIGIRNPATGGAATDGTADDHEYLHCGLDAPPALTCEVRDADRPAAGTGT
jgi:hypothetical protein